MISVPGWVLLMANKPGAVFNRKKRNIMEKIITNTRFVLLLILGGVAFILICAEYESLALTVFCKLHGFGIASITYLLARYWHAKGRLQEWDEWSQD